MPSLVLKGEAALLLRSRFLYASGYMKPAAAFLFFPAVASMALTALSAHDAVAVHPPPRKKLAASLLPENFQRERGCILVFSGGHEHVSQPVFMTNQAFRIACGLYLR